MSGFVGLEWIKVAVIQKVIRFRAWGIKELGGLGFKGFA